MMMILMMMTVFAESLAPSGSVVVVVLQILLLPLHRLVHKAMFWQKIGFRALDMVDCEEEKYGDVCWYEINFRLIEEIKTHLSRSKKIYSRVREVHSKQIKFEWLKNLCMNNTCYYFLKHFAINPFF